MENILRLCSSDLARKVMYASIVSVPFVAYNNYAKPKPLFICSGSPDNIYTCILYNRGNVPMVLKDVEVQLENNDTVKIDKLGTIVKPHHHTRIFTTVSEENYKKMVSSLTNDSSKVVYYYDHPFFSTYREVVDTVNVIDYS